MATKDQAVLPSSTRHLGAGHIKPLDGLRGLAVLGVMCSHLFIGNGAKAGRAASAVQGVLQHGAMGVDLFFVLSGFLITRILYDSIDDAGYFRKFYARRVLRIFPLYYGVLLLALALTPWLHIHWQGMQWELLTYTQNTAIVMPFSEWSASPWVGFDHFWSLAVEEQFYFVWPVLVYLLRDQKKLLWICLAAILFAPGLRLFLLLHGHAYNEVNRSTACRADSLLMGAGLSFLAREPWRGKLLRCAPYVLGGSVLALIVLEANVLPRVLERAVKAESLDALTTAVVFSLEALASAALISMCLRPVGQTRRVFENRVMRFFGRYAYGIYVLHFVALGWLLPHLRAWMSVFTGNRLISYSLAGLLAGTIGVAAAVLSYELYEKRFLRLKRFFDYAPTARGIQERIASSAVTEA